LQQWEIFKKTGVSFKYYGVCRYFPPTAFYHNGSEKIAEKRKKTHLFGFMKINVKEKLEIARNAHLWTPKKEGN
jgi:hypothetical protein